MAIVEFYDTRPEIMIEIPATPKLASAAKGRRFVERMSLSGSADERWVSAAPRRSEPSQRLFRRAWS